MQAVRESALGEALLDIVDVEVPESLVQEMGRNEFEHQLIEWQTTVSFKMSWAAALPISQTAARQPVHHDSSSSFPRLTLSVLSSPLCSYDSGMLCQQNSHAMRHSKAAVVCYRVDTVSTSDLDLAE